MSDAKKPANSKRITVMPADEAAADDETSKPVIVHRPMLKAPGVSAPPDDPAAVASETPVAGTVTLKTSDKLALKPLDVSQADNDDTATAPSESPPKETAAAEPDKTTTPDKPADPAAEEPEVSKDEASSDAGKAGEESEEKKAPTEDQINAEAEVRAKHDEAVQKLVDSKQYFLPINAVEKRKTKHFLILGVVLSVLLLLAWGDIALDAGLVQVPGVKPFTHFFSN
jgi:hypothetical protein